MAQQVGGAGRQLMEAVWRPSLAAGPHIAASLHPWFDCIIRAAPQSPTRPCLCVATPPPLLPPLLFPCALHLQQYLGQQQPGTRLRRSSMELDPGSAAAALYQDAFAASLKAADPLSLLLSQQAASGMVPNGYPPASAGLSQAMGMPPGQNGYDNLPLMDIGEDPGPLPVLPRAGRMGPGSYGYSGAPGPGMGRQPRPRRHR